MPSKCPDLFDPVLRSLLKKFPICYQSCSNETLQHYACNSFPHWVVCVFLISTCQVISGVEVWNSWRKVHFGLATLTSLPSLPQSSPAPGRLSMIRNFPGRMSQYISCTLMCSPSLHMGVLVITLPSAVRKASCTWCVPHLAFACSTSLKDCSTSGSKPLHWEYLEAFTWNWLSTKSTAFIENSTLTSSTLYCDNCVMCYTLGWTLYCII